MNDEFEIDVQGIPIPAWLASKANIVVDVRLGDDVVTFEGFSWASTAFTCTWPRYASMITQPDPDRECGWNHPVYDQEIFTAHAMKHLENKIDDHD